MADAGRTLEPFPSLSSDTTYNGSSSATSTGRTSRALAPKPRRKSSNLGGDPRGDTGGAAFATLSGPLAGVSTSPLPSPAEVALPRRSKRRKARSLLRRYVRLSLRHTWLTPLLLVLAILALYAVNPSTSNPFHACIFLSYPQPGPDHLIGGPLHYGKGRADFAFVAFYAIVLSFTREFLMQRFIHPLAVRWGIRKRAKQARFMEQFYTAMYFAIYGPFGLYVMSRTPVWYFNTTGMFEGFPHRSHEAVVKAYYLLQASYWAQQGLVLVLMLEKPRKDFKELVAHHIVTLALIWLSYRFHFTYMGIAVYITHDISDFTLAVSLFPPSLPSLLVLTKASKTDIQSPQLHRLPPHSPLLRLLHRRLGLPPPLHQSAHLMGRPDRIPHRGTLYLRLGDSTIQMLDLTDHYLCAVGRAAGVESVLVCVDS